LYDKDALQMRVDELQEQVDTLQHDRAAADAALTQAVEAAEARGHAAEAAAAAAATTATAADGNDRREEEMRYQLFAELMAAFETEREAWGQQERRQQQLLATATRSVSRGAVCLLRLWLASMLRGPSPATYTSRDIWAPAHCIFHPQPSPTSLLVHDRTSSSHRRIALPPSRDLLYLAQENERLRRDLQQAILYEPPVRPLRPIRGTPNGSGSD